MHAVHSDSDDNNQRISEKEARNRAGRAALDAAVQSVIDCVNISVAQYGVRFDGPASAARGGSLPVMGNSVSEASCTADCPSTSPSTAVMSTLGDLTLDSIEGADQLDDFELQLQQFRNEFFMHMQGPYHSRVRNTPADFHRFPHISIMLQHSLANIKTMCERDEVEGAVQSVISAVDEELSRIGACVKYVYVYIPPCPAYPFLLFS